MGTARSPGAALVSAAGVPSGNVSASTSRISASRTGLPMMPQASVSRRRAVVSAEVSAVRKNTGAGSRTPKW